MRPARRAAAPGTSARSGGPFADSAVSRSLRLPPWPRSLSQAEGATIFGGRPRGFPVVDGRGGRPGAGPTSCKTRGLPLPSPVMPVVSAVPRHSDPFLAVTGQCSDSPHSPRLLGGRGGSRRRGGARAGPARGSEKLGFRQALRPPPRRLRTLAARARTPRSQPPRGTSKPVRTPSGRGLAPGQQTSGYSDG